MRWFWERCGENPVRLVQEFSPLRLQRVAADPAPVRRARALVRELGVDLARPAASAAATPERPIAFCCAEYGTHRSLPRCAGGMPRGWLRRVKASLRTNAARFTATRMLRDYLARLT